MCKIQLVTFTPLNSHADLASVTLGRHEQSAAAGLKPTEITRGKGKWWCYKSLSVCRSMSGHVIGVEDKAEVVCASMS